MTRVPSEGLTLRIAVIAWPRGLVTGICLAPSDIIDLRRPRHGTDTFTRTRRLPLYESHSMNYSFVAALRMRLRFTGDSGRARGMQRSLSLRWRSPARERRFGLLAWTLPRVISPKQLIHQSLSLSGALCPFRPASNSCIFSVCIGTATCPSALLQTPSSSGKAPRSKISAC